MKKLVCLIAVFAVIMLSASCTAKINEVSKNDIISGLLNSEQSVSESSEGTDKSGSEIVASGDEMRGIWISYSELSTAFEGNFETEIGIMFDNIKSLGLNTVFVHARAFCDAFYPSTLFPWSAYITGTEGVAPECDPLEIMVREAKKRDLEVHAWINPYRISYKTDDFGMLADSSYVKQYMAKNPNCTFAVKYDGGLYLNPANPDAEKLIVDGVKEILDNYNVDGIHFDDYFYPTTSEDFDRSDYTAYFENNDNPMSLADWRRDNVSRMLKSVYSAVKSYGEDIVFGVSPAGNNERNFDELYADTDAWVSGGYIDYIIPQLYFGYGYLPEKFSYGSLVSEWSKYSDKTKLYVGLGAYKIGAGSNSEKADWISGNLLERQITDSRKLNYGGFVVFSYSSLFSNDEINTNERNRISQLIGAD